MKTLRERSLAVPGMILTVALLSSTASAWGGVSSRGADAEWRAAQSDNIRIAVFAYQMQQEYQDRPASLQAYFLCGGLNANEEGRSPRMYLDPSAAVLARFRWHTPPVRGIGEFGQFPGPTVGWSAVGCRVYKVTWVNHTEVEAAGEMFPLMQDEPVGDATGYTYFLSLRHGHWVVRRMRADWIT